MTRYELCRARHMDVVRFADWLGVFDPWFLPREILVDEVMTRLTRPLAVKS